MVGTFFIAYNDDNLIYSPDEMTHVEHIKMVLSQLLKTQLYVKGEKCEFLVKKKKVGFPGVHHRNRVGDYGPGQGHSSH